MKRNDLGIGTKIWIWLTLPECYVHLMCRQMYKNHPRWVLSVFLTTPRTIHFLIMLSINKRFIPSFANNQSLPHRCFSPIWYRPYVKFLFKSKFQIWIYMPRYSSLGHTGREFHFSYPCRSYRSYDRIDREYCKANVYQCRNYLPTVKALDLYPEHGRQPLNEII